MIYLASPYSHPDKDVEHRRYVAVAAYAAVMFRANPQVLRISPIAYWHPIATHHKLPTEADAYKEFNQKLLRHCLEMEILALPGWEESAGVLLERQWAEELGIGVSIVKAQKV